MASDEATASGMSSSANQHELVKGDFRWHFEKM